MIGARHASAAVFFAAKEADAIPTPASTISPAVKTINSLGVGLRNGSLNFQEEISFTKEKSRKVSVRSEACCRLLSQSEYCYRVSDQLDSCHGSSNQSQNNNRSNILDKNSVCSIKQPIKSNALRSVKNNEALFASLTMICAQKNGENQIFSKSSSTREFGASYDMAMKVILLGDCSVGKTCFLRTMSRVKDEEVTGCCKEFRDGEMADIVFRREGKRTMVRIIDTGGQERYRSLTSSYYRGIHGCLLVFDVTREETFNNVMNWYQDLGRYSTDQFVAGILVGTTSATRHRTVSSDRGAELAVSLGFTYTECNPNDEVMTSAIVQRLKETVKKMGLRRRSSPVIIKPQMKGNKQSYNANLMQSCVCI